MNDTSFHAEALVCSDNEEVVVLSSIPSLFNGKKEQSINLSEMLSLNTSCGFCGVSTSTKAFQFHFRTSSSPFFFSPLNNFKLRSSIAKSFSTFSNDSNSSTEEPKSNYAGVLLEEIVHDGGIKSGKLRLDSWISSRINGISRARVQSSIKAGLVHVNGRVVDKVSISISTVQNLCLQVLITTNFYLAKCNLNPHEIVI